MTGSRRHRARIAIVRTVSAAIVMAVGLLGGDAYAQTATGGIRGVVSDETGAVLAGVTVEVTSPSLIGGPRVDVTNGQGQYQQDRLPIGIYRITFTLQGFTTIARENVRVEVGRTIDVDATLAVQRRRRNGHRVGRRARGRQPARGHDDELQPPAAAEHPEHADVVVRHRGVHAGSPDGSAGRQQRHVLPLRLELRPEFLSVRRHGHHRARQRHRLGLSQPRHDRGAAVRWCRRVRRARGVPGRHRQPGDQVGQQPLQAAGQRVLRQRPPWCRTTRRTSCCPTRSTTTRTTPGRLAGRSRRTASGSRRSSSCCGTTSRRSAWTSTSRRSSSGSVISSR